MSAKRTFMVLSIVILTLILVGCMPPAAPAPAAQPAQQQAAAPPSKPQPLRRLPETSGAAASKSATS